MATLLYKSLNKSELYQSSIKLSVKVFGVKLTLPYSSIESTFQFDGVIREGSCNTDDGCGDNDFDPLTTPLTILALLKFSQKISVE